MLRKSRLHVAHASKQPSVGLERNVFQSARIRPVLANQWFFALHCLRGIERSHCGRPVAHCIIHGLTRCCVLCLRPAFRFSMHLRCGSNPSASRLQPVSHTQSLAIMVFTQIEASQRTGSFSLQFVLSLSCAVQSRQRSSEVRHFPYLPSNDLIPLFPVCLNRIATGSRAAAHSSLMAIPTA